jgi:two-component system, OmpR family, phosphate regulon sensor histidine kinase PhoR
VKEPRSIIFYAWAGLAIQSLLVAGAIAFALAGATYQRAATATRLAHGGGALAARSQPILGVGLGWSTAILAAALLLPVATAAAGLRWAGGPLLAATTAVRRRALGDTEVRAVPGGPADVLDLALSFNLLADESDRARARELEGARLHAEIGRASARIREHLRGQAIIKEAVTAIREHLVADFVWVGMVSGERLSMARADQDAWGQLTDVVGYLAPDSVDWIRGIYRHRASYLVQDLHASPAAEIPADTRRTLLGLDAASLLLTPFGAGQELLGCLALTRTDPGHAWAQPEIEAVESLAGDIGRALEHARLYEGEERLVAELKSLDQAKSSFLAAASHDVRTPLTSIIGYVELMSDGDAGPVSPHQAKMLDAVNRNARRLKTMVEDMLTVSKIELGAFTSRLCPLDLTGVVRAAADEIRPSAATGGLAFGVDCPDHALVVDGDAEQLDRVLANLLSNAVKYTPKGGSVTLTVQGAADCAVLTVADTGIGIPEADQAALFTRFFRASNAVEAAIQGSGLGLSIVRTIVTNHHGDLSIESAQDQGTAVTVRIPLHGRAAAPLVTMPAASGNQE